MVERVRKVLLTDYIGAIVVALQVAVAVRDFIGLLLLPVRFWSERGVARDTFFGLPVTRPESFPWQLLIAPGVGVALDILAAYLLVRWLYLPTLSTVSAKTEAADSGEPKP